MNAQSLGRLNEWLESLVRTPGEPGDIRSTLQHITDIAQRIFATDVCVSLAFHLVTGRFMPLEPAIIAGNVQEQEFPYEPLIPEELAHTVLQQGTLLVEDVEQSADENHRQFMRAKGIRSFAAVALRTRHRQKPLAVLYLNFRQPRQFTLHERQMLKLFATPAAFLLQETWLLWRYREVARIGQELNHELSTVDNLFHRLYEHIGNIVNTSGTFMLAVCDVQTHIWDLYREEEGKAIIRRGEAPDIASQYVQHSQEPLFLQRLSREAYEDLPFALDDETRARLKETLIVLPLVSRDLSLGVLVLQHAQPGTYNREDFFILQLLANHIALALNNIRLYGSLSMLHETGQVLTQQLDSEQTLQAIVDKIRDVTKADLAILFPYIPPLQQFSLPARYAGTLLQPSSILSMSRIRSGNVAELMLRQPEPLFVKNSETITAELGDASFTRQGNFEQREEICSTAAIPLLINEVFVGVLFVNFRQPQRFDGPQKLLIEGLAHYAAVAIKNAQAFDALNQRRTQELGILQDIDRELNRTLDLQHILDLILELAFKHITCDEATIALYDPDTHELRNTAAVGRNAEARKTVVIPFEENNSIARWSFEHKQPARVDNVHQDEPWRTLYFQVSTDIVSELDVPLLDEDDVVGVLNFESTREAAFSQEDQIFLQTLAGQTVLAVKKAQAYDREKRFAAETQVLNDISKQITSQLNFEHVFGMILEQALTLTDSKHGILAIYDPELDNLWIADKRGVAEHMKGQRVSLDQGIIGYVARTKQVLNVDPSQPPWSDIYLDLIPGTHAELTVPMLAGDDIRGVLDVESPRAGNFKERDIRLLKALADLAVVALQNAESYEKAERETRRFAQLYRAGQDLGDINDETQLEQAYDSILHIVQMEHQESRVVIRRYSEEDQELVPVRVVPQHNTAPLAAITLNDEVIGRAERERRTIVIYDLASSHLQIMQAHVSDPTIHSLVIVHIQVKDRYYGTLELNHRDIGYFHNSDVQFLEGLAQQLASTIYRLQAAAERQDFEKRALVAEEMSSIGQSAVELTHRLGNDLGAIPTLVDDIQDELAKQGETPPLIHKKLEDTTKAVQTVLNLNRKLKSDLAQQAQVEKEAGAPIAVPPQVLFNEVMSAVILPETVKYQQEIDPDVVPVQVTFNLVADILHNLVINALEAMQGGGQLTLSAHNAGRVVALEISDTGIGIPPDMHTKIFDLFYSTKKSSGFGLWSAKRNALKNRGELRVTSTPGQGTTFTLLLPKANEVEGQ